MAVQSAWFRRVRAPRRSPAAAYPLADAAAAVRDGQRNAASGKIVLVP